MTPNNITDKNVYRRIIMRYLKTAVLLLVLLASTLIVTACSTEKQAVETQQLNSTLGNESREVAPDGTPIILEMNGTEVRAVLNDTLTAKEFMKLLPYSVTVSRAADDLCGSVREELPSDPTEGQKSWELGEIGWFGGWFTILVDHEERFSNMPGVMIIGKVVDADMDTVTAFTGRVDITVRLAE